MNVLFQGNTDTGKDEWLTPPYIIKALGPFDLDPCSPINRPWHTAKYHYTKEHDGLKQHWDGRVWCNPPYDNTEAWFQTCVRHGNAMGLCYASTETGWFFRTIWHKATGILFPDRRFNFYHVDGTKGGSPGKSSVLVAWGIENANRLKMAAIKEIPGKYISLL